MNNRRRRLRRGSIPRAGRPEKASPGRRTTTRTAAPTSPDGWAKWVRDRYELDASEDQLLELAVDSLKLSRDEGQDPKVRLTAMGRYQALLRQLGLEAAEEEHGTSQNVVRFAGRR